MSKHDIVLVTQREYLHPIEDDQYHRNILIEDQLLLDALERVGFRGIRVGWDNPSFRWTDTKLVLIRATWDYFHRINEFKKWLEIVNNMTVLINPLPTLKWNMDKHYLQELFLKGVNIPETRFIEIGESSSLYDLCKESGWEKWILKPAISGAARHTYLFDPTSIADHESVYRKLVTKESMLLQRFQPDVINNGEWTLVLINGKYTHAVLKRAKMGDFRVQDDFGGTVHDHQATKEEISFAEGIMSHIDPIPAYGRVDIIRDVHGKLALQELELIEPELWFRNCPNAAALLASHLKSIVHI